MKLALRSEQEFKAWYKNSSETIGVGNRKSKLVSSAAIAEPLSLAALRVRDR